MMNFEAPQPQIRRKRELQTPWGGVGFTLNLFCHEPVNPNSFSFISLDRYFATFATLLPVS